MDGILLINKPKGWSSFDVIRKVKAALSQESENRKKELGKNQIPNSQFPIPKIGHAGTLDPMATGLLILLFGSATKQAGKFLKLDKAYEAELTLGATSTTDDAEGHIKEARGQKLAASRPGLKELEQALQRLTGEIEQTPPQHSAIKVAGQRAYSLARKGQAVKLEPRTVTIYDLRLSTYEYPKLRIETSVSSGTYIRSLARDIGESVGCGAYLSGLRRTRIGDYFATEAKGPEQLNKESIQNSIQLLH